MRAASSSGDPSPAGGISCWSTCAEPDGARAFSQRSRGYVARAGRCAKQIGPERDLYSTSQAVQDLEAVLRSLHAGKIGRPLQATMPAP